MIMDFFKGVGWFLVNVAVPLLGPIALLPLLGLRKKYKGRVRKILLRAVQEGQLCWTVIAMCVAACYEALGDVEGAPVDADLNAIVRVVAITWHVLMIVCSATVVMFGAEDAEDELLYQQSAEGRRALAAAVVATEEIIGQFDRPTPIMKASVAMAAATAITFLATHIWAA